MKPRGWCGLIRASHLSDRSPRLVNPLHLVLCVMALLLPAVTLAEGRAIIVLDASGSMWDELDGRPKHEIAQEALEAVLQSVPANAELGLLAYGHREKGNCADIELVVPPARGAAATIGSTAAGLNFTGKTPLTAAVAMAAEALDSRNQPATVILITDGMDNCSGDPCALARMLEETGERFTTHVVGFGLTPDEAAAVSCLARDTGGNYLQADDLATLTLALQDTVLVLPAEPSPPSPPPVTVDPSPAPTPAPLPDPVQPIPNFAPTVLLSADGPTLDPAAPVTFSLLQPGQTAASDATIVTPASILPAGSYTLETRIGAVTVTQPLIVGDDGPGKPTIILDAAEITLAPRVAPGAAIEVAADITIKGVSSKALTLTQPFKTWLPAGDYSLTARLDAVTTTQQIQVAAGAPVQQDIIISAAAIVPNVLYAPGQPVSAADLQIDIVRAAANADGSRSLVSTHTGGSSIFHLGAGDYAAIATLGLARVEVPFSIALVQRTELPITLNAGVLAVAAAGASRITITLPPDIAGNATELASVATDTVQETLNAGSYQVTAAFGDAVATASVVITPGGRADLVLGPP